MPTNTSHSSSWLVVAAVLGGLAVAFGAFGAHGLKARFTADDPMLANWETAARYQMYHALALLAVGLLAVHSSSRALNIAGLCMTLGTVIFSGCLYALVLTGERRLGAIVPIGGVLMIVGWLFLAIAAFRSASP
jgi:uncharacterized membrane protein YgdD (TMEM256/DUF423 family)